MCSHCAVVRQVSNGQSYKAQMVLVPQRGGFGLCGSTPSLLSVDAWSDAYGSKADFLVASRNDIFNNGSRIEGYSIPNDTFTSTSSQAAPLPTCWGALRDLRATHILHQGVLVPAASHQSQISSERALDH